MWKFIQQTCDLILRPTSSAVRFSEVMSGNADAQSLLKVAKKRMMQSETWLTSHPIAALLKQHVFSVPKIANTRAVTGGLVGESSSECTEHISTSPDTTQVCACLHIQFSVDSCFVHFEVLLFTFLCGGLWSS